MKDVLDVHIHTTASGHAYSTFGECIAAAKARGLELIGIADHAPTVPDTIGNFYFKNFKVIPRDAYGIKIVMGCELNIIDYSGSTDLAAQILKRLDYCIASLHKEAIEPGNVAENTAALIGAMRNPHVVIIGHPDNPKFPVDFEAVVRAAADNKVLLEINNSSYVYTHRAGSADNAKIMLAACKRYGTKIIIGSDAHIDIDVGNHTAAHELLAANNFPEELVVNHSVEDFMACVAYRKSLAP